MTATDDTTQRDRRPQAGGMIGVIGAAGGVLVVGLGLVFVFVIALVALGTVPDSQKAAVVTAAFTVLGTIVGAYFGVKVGSAGRQEAEAARDAEAVKVQEFAARADPETAKAALDSAQERVAATTATGGGPPASII
jgi:hypothetical protein